MKIVTSLYQELLELARPKYSDTHGLQILHKGKNVDENSILFVGRENRGHGGKISGYKNPIVDFNEYGFSWLGDSYRFTGSPFWLVIGKSLSRVTGAPYDVRIFEKIYWTNIFKVSPYERRANTHKMRRFQGDLCSRLLLEEIRVLRPKAVVFLTDNWVWDYLNRWEKQGAISKPIMNSKAAGYFNCEFHFGTDSGPVPALVIPHPQNKKGVFREHHLEDRMVSFLKK